MPTSFGKADLQNFMHDEDNLECLRTHTGIPEEKAVCIFEYSMDSNHKAFIMVDRKDHNDIVGYMFIKKVKTFWQVLSVEVYKKYQGHGLGLDMYVKVIQSGYDLINGTSLSAQAENIWVDKLPKFVDIRVVNIKTSEIENLSDKPKKDNASDGDQQWFYLARSKSATLEGLAENFNPADLGWNIAYERWLLDDPTFHFPMVFRSSKYGEPGDF